MAGNTGTWLPDSIDRSTGEQESRTEKSDVSERPLTFQVHSGSRSAEGDFYE
jgi:hypothetical protein